MQKFLLKLMNTHYLFDNVPHYMWTDILIYQHYMHWQYFIAQQYGNLACPTYHGLQHSTGN
jgi:hypothetical protein